MARVDLAQQHLADILDLLHLDIAAGVVVRHLAQRLDHVGLVLAHILGLIDISAMDLLEHVLKSGPAEPRLARKISTAPKRLTVWIEKHGQRPATLLAHQRDGALVDRVEIGAFLAVDFDTDEEIVHQRRRLFMLKALMRHDVAPMTGRVTDRQ